MVCWLDEGILFGLNVTFVWKRGKQLSGNGLKKNTTLNSEQNQGMLS
jgi:hypothetical protein